MDALISVPKSKPVDNWSNLVTAIHMVVNATAPPRSNERPDVIPRSLCLLGLSPCTTTRQALDARLGQSSAYGLGASGWIGCCKRR